MTGLEASARSYLRAAVMACIALVCTTGALYAGQLSHSPEAATNGAPGHPPTVPKSPPVTESKPLFQAIEAGRLAPSYDDVAEARVEPALQPKVERFKLDRPISIAGLLRDAGLEEPERNAWAEAFRSSAHWGVLSPGHQVSVFKDPKT